ncbi:MAG: hypothetical protein WD448_07535 [Woeseia sp.]
MPKNPCVRRAVRIWLNIGTSVLVGAAGVGCSDQPGETGRDALSSRDIADETPGTTRSATAIPGPSAGGEGEGESSSGADPVTDDVEYLHRLGQARGHLVAFTALHHLGQHEMAATHAKHPESELYADLLPAFAARDKEGFAGELAALADAAETNEDVGAAYDDVQNAIRENEPAAAFATRLMAIATLTRTAAVEYGIGVADDGTVVNAHEYQDAYGFLAAAREMLADTKTTSAAEAEAAALAKEQIETALGQFDTLTATRVDGDASVIHGAAARIEIKATMLRQSER